MAPLHSLNGLASLEIDWPGMFRDPGGRWGVDRDADYSMKPNEAQCGPSNIPRFRLVSRPVSVAFIKKTLIPTIPYSVQCGGRGGGKSAAEHFPS